MVRQKAAKPVDFYVGQRIRMRRHQLNMSQTDLGKACGLTFQQIQKYEKGTNRVGASRLQQIADAMKTPVFWFFKDAPSAQTNATATAETLALSQFTGEHGGMKLLGNWALLSSAERNTIGTLVDHLARRKR